MSNVMFDVIVKDLTRDFTMAVSVFNEPFASKGISLKEEVEIGETQLQAHVIDGVKVQHVAQSQLKNNIFEVEDNQIESRDSETIKEQPYEQNLCPLDFEDSIGTQDRISLPLKNNHTCSVCGKSFRRKHTLTIHINSHTGKCCKETKTNSRFECTLCEKSYIKQCSLNNHMNYHRGVCPFNCEICPKSFRSRKQLLVHNKSHSDEKQYKCKFCGKKFKYYSSRYAHQKTHSDHHLHFQCDMCKIDFQSEDQYRSHLEENKCKENSGRRHKCTLCEKSYRHVCNLKIHMNFHRGVLPFKCDICSKAFGSERDLLVHNNSHSDEKQYKCKFCDKKFKFNSSRYAHQKTHSDHHLHFQCDMCKIDFQSEDQYRSHLEENKCKENSDRRHKCTLCEKSYRHVCSLNIHMNFHRGVRPYKCDICPKAFRSEGDLSVHNNSHSVEKQYKCKFCDKKFKYYSSRYAHQKKHSDHRLHFQCDICKIDFLSEDQYRSHLEANKCKENTENVGEIEKSEEQMQSQNEIEKIRCEGKSQKKDAFEKKYKCDVCSKTFICKRNLSFHMRSHSK